MGLLDYARDAFSQNGEDGILAEVFRRVGTSSRWCCEFGAWDGEHLSNTRNVILQGWSAVLIEADPTRFAKLDSRYASRPDVRCVNTIIATPEPLGALLDGVPRLDLLSVDVDGLDYEIVAALDIEPPRVLCVEVNAGHDPAAIELLPREVAAENVGQPLGAFIAALEPLGYRLVAYTGNAIFVHQDALGVEGVSPEDVYAEFLRHLGTPGREWLYLVNLGLVNPHYSYRNPWLTRRGLHISPRRAWRLRRAH